MQFGPGYAGARDGYVYLTATKARTAPRAFYLMRVPTAGLGEASYEYFAGTAAAPAWDAAPAAARPVFADPGGVNGQDVVYDAGLDRYLVTVGHGADGSSGGGLGVFEGPTPWGPWWTVEYEGRWLRIRGGSFLGLHLASPWMADGGRTLWGVFSCWGRRGACGHYGDRYNLMRATLTVRGAAAATGRDAR